MASVTGTSGNDLIDATDGVTASADSITGLAGNDTIVGLAGNDSIWGGSGNDSVDGGADADSIFGEEGDDTLIGGTGTGLDSLFGGLGNDVLFGGAGTDSLSGGDGNDTFFGGADGDRIDGGSGLDVLNLSGAGGNLNIDLNSSTITSAEGVDTIISIEGLIGGTGADSLAGNASDNYLEGGSGTDSLVGNDGADTLVGGAGIDQLYGGLGNDTFIEGNGTSSAGDSLFGGDGADTADYSASTAAINANLSGATDTVNPTGNTDTDTLVGVENIVGSNLSTVDTITGDGEANRFYGLAGADSLIGNGGNDTLVGGAGADRMFGGDGDDWFELGVSHGNDVIQGGEATETTGDVLDASELNTGVNVTFSGSEVGTVTTGLDTISFSQIENFDLTDYADTLNASAATAPVNVEAAGGADSITGSSGNDTIDAGTGSDTVSGGGGDDLIYGGSTSSVDTSYILNGTFTGGGSSWSGTDTEFNPESSYFSSGSSANGVAELDGTTTAFTVMEQSFVVDGAVSAELTFRGIVRTDGQVGTDGYRVDILDGSGTVIGTITVLPGSNTVWTDYSLNFDFPAAGTYTLRFTELGNNNSLGALVDDVQIKSTTTLDDVADTLSGGTGNDTIFGGAGADSVVGDAGNDSLSGDAGNDTLDGGADNDSLFGGDGVDSLVGNTGNDSLEGGTGTDSLYGGTGNDLFTIHDGDVNDTLSAEFVDGGGTGGELITTDFDTLDISEYGWARVVISYSSTDPLDLSGTITIYTDATKTVILGTIQFDEIENIIPCFTPGTMILTDRGDVAVEALVAGDLVMTRDHGLQPLRWVGRRELSYLDLLANPDLQPVRIGQGALGADRTMLVSAQHRVLIEGAGAEMLFGEAEVLVAAKHLVGLADVTRALPSEGVTYLHLLFDRHEIVHSDGIWTESFQPAERMLSAMDAEVRAEVLALFPELESSNDAFVAARLSLKAHEAKALLKV